MCSHDSLKKEGLKIKRNFPEFFFFFFTKRHKVVSAGY